jgi:hypothetical protein
MFKKLTLAALCSMVCATCFAAAPTYTMRVALPKPADSAVPPVVPSTPAVVRAWTVPQNYSDTFESVLVGTSSHLMLELTNTGTSADSLATPSFTGSPDFAVSGSTCTAVPTNGTCRLTLRFTPASESPQQATLNVAGKAVQYRGTGLRAPTVTSAMLLHMNGTAGTTSFSDAYGTAVTNIGGVQVTSAAKFGAGAARFNGANQGLVFSNETFNFGSADYTVEAWVKPRAGNSNLQSVISNSWGWQLYWGNSAFSFYVSSNPGGPGYYSGMPMNSAVGSAPAEAWSHVAVVRNGASLKLFVNGNLASSVPFTASQAAPLYPASLGVIYTSDTAASYYFGGDIDEFRITKNFARYTANFTPDSQEFVK